MARTTHAAPPPAPSLSRRHLLVGWTGLLIFLTLGIALEAFHALKVDFYLDVRNETRRHMWRLAHAHGTLLSLVHIAFALSLNALRAAPPRSLHLASVCLTGSLIAIPPGFFLGGFWLYGGDPGIGVFLVPVGAVMLLVAVGTILVVLYQQGREVARPTSPVEPRPGGGTSGDETGTGTAGEKRRKTRRK